MRVVGVSLVQVSLVLHSSLDTSTGSHVSRTAALVQVTLGDGTAGWGEDVAPEGSFYTGETAAESLRVLRENLVAAAADRDFETPVDLDAAWWGTSEFPMARCAVESAVWDAWCRGRGTPLAAALGGSPRNIAVGAVVGLHDDTEHAVDEAVRRTDGGYRHLKLKIAPGRDREVVSAVRDAVGDDVTVSVDANGAYTADDVALLASLADSGVGLVEQPFAPHDLEAAQRLRRTRTVKVGLDESIMSVADLDAALSLGAIDALNVKPSRLGGLGVAVTMLDRCRAEGIDAWVGGMLESGIGRAAALALASHPACTLPPDLSASDRYFAADVSEPFVLVEGTLAVPAVPGLGREPSAVTLREARIEPLL